ncbi:MAG: hypothetical protein H6825_13830 [Planctomycetes bacterium]|nr:hypothetical protein [Planctomycetota bacterium]
MTVRRVASGGDGARDPCAVRVTHRAARPWIGAGLSLAGMARAACVALLAGVVVGCAAEPPVPAGGEALGVQAVRLADVVDGSPEADVVAEIRSLYADLSTRDWDAFAEHFWEGATLTAVWQPHVEDAPRVVVTTVPDFVRQAPDGPGSREIFEERMLDADLRVDRDHAHVWSRFFTRFGDPGRVMEWTGVDAFTLVRHDGRWRVVGVCYVADREGGTQSALDVAGAASPSTSSP